MIGIDKLMEMPSRLLVFDTISQFDTFIPVKHNEMGGTGNVQVAGGGVFLLSLRREEWATNPGGGGGGRGGQKIYTPARTARGTPHPLCPAPPGRPPPPPPPGQQTICRGWAGGLFIVTLILYPVLWTKFICLCHLKNSKAIQTEVECTCSIGCLVVFALYLFWKIVLQWVYSAQYTPLYAHCTSSWVQMPLDVYLGGFYCILKIFASISNQIPSYRERFFLRKGSSKIFNRF